MNNSLSTRWKIVIAALLACAVAAALTWVEWRRTTASEARVVFHMYGTRLIELRADKGEHYSLVLLLERKHLPVDAATTIATSQAMTPRDAARILDEEDLKPSGKAMVLSTSKVVLGTPFDTGGAKDDIGILLRLPDPVDYQSDAVAGHVCLRVNVDANNNLWSALPDLPGYQAFWIGRNDRSLKWDGDSMVLGRFVGLSTTQGDYWTGKVCLMRERTR